MSEKDKTKNFEVSGSSNTSEPKKPEKKANRIAGQGMKKDTVTTLLFKTNHQNFAEVFNHTVLAEAPISPEDLQEEDIKETAYLQITKEGGGTTMVQYRDVVKGVQEGAECREKKNRRNERQMKLLLAILGIENQENIHYGMPFRVLEIDFVNYARQIRNIENRHQEEWKDEAGHRHLPADITKEEYLGRFLKTDKLLPCITLVVYWGEKPWDGPRRLSDLFADCPWASLAWDMELNLSDELTHAPELKELRNPQYQTQKGDFNMSTAIQEMILEGEQKGKKEGRREGRKEGLRQGIEGSVALLREAGLEDQLIVEKIMMRFGLTLAVVEGKTQ